MGSRRRVLSVWAHSARWRALLALLGLSARGPLRRASISFDPGAPQLVLAPHPDDAVLNCWSVLTSGLEVRVVNVFAGTPRPGFVSEVDRSLGAQESADHMRARIAEDEAVLARVGQRPTNLGFLDIQYGPRRLPLRELDRALAQAVPAASLAYAPAALGYAHADHLLVRAYAFALARAGVPVRLYADLPYAVDFGWPLWVSGDSGDAAADDLWRPALRALPAGAAVEVVELGPDAADRKRAAMRAYATQFDMLDVGGRLSDPAIPAREVFWSIPAQPLAALPGVPATAGARGAGGRT